MKVFFSHPIKTYATPEALEVLKALKEEYPGYTIVDPEDYNIPEKRFCENCRFETMEAHLFPLIKECEVFALWAPIATCDVECEFHYAWHCEEKLYVFISYSVGEIDFETLTLQDYHRIESQTPVEEIV